MATFTRSDDLRGAEFVDANLRGARFVRADLCGVVMRGVDVDEAEIDAPWLFGGGSSFRINGVDVAPFVEAELNRRFPGRGERRAGDPEGLRAAWAAVERTWAATLERVAAMPAGTTEVSVAGEWSFAQTLRHLIMATDVWLGGSILELEQPYHPIGQPYAEYESDGYDMSVFTAVTPSYAEVLEVRAGRVAMVRDFIDTVTPDVLAAPRKNPWAPDRDETVLSCLHVILHEEWEHHRYAVRDLDAIEAGVQSGARPTVSRQEDRAAPVGTYDVAAVRAQFPALRNGAAHFDGPGGSQTPAPVAQRIYDTLVGPLANRGADSAAQRNAEQAVLDGRAALADLLGVESTGVIFGRSMTQNTFDVARVLAKRWGPGDEVVVTRLDHDANVRPWVLTAEASGATVRWADFDPAIGELDPSQVEAVLSPRTRLVAVTAASNLLGTMPDLSAISELVHGAGAWLYVDGVHYAAHALVDVPSLGADFFACSPYKFLGPHCGAVYGRPEILEELWPDKLRPAADDIPERFELGTLPYELMAGMAAAVDFLADLAPHADGAHATRRERLVESMTMLEAYEDGLRREIEEFLETLPGATLHSRAAKRTPTLLVTFEGHDCGEIARFLAARGVNAPAGSFYAYEASHRLGLGDAGGLRIGLAPYNDRTDVERLRETLTSYFDR